MKGSKRVNWLFLNVLQKLLDQLLKNCDMSLRREVIEAAAEYEHKLHKGSKAIFHLEAFVATFMSLYLEYIESMGNL